MSKKTKSISADDFAKVMKRGDWTDAEIVKLRWRLRAWERMLAAHVVRVKVIKRLENEARRAKRLGLVSRVTEWGSKGCWIDPEAEKRSLTPVRDWDKILP